MPETREYRKERRGWRRGTRGMAPSGYKAMPTIKECCDKGKGKAKTDVKEGFGNEKIIWAQVQSTQQEN